MYLLCMLLDMLKVWDKKIHRILSTTVNLNCLIQMSPFKPELAFLMSCYLAGLEADTSFCCFL